MKDSKKTLKKKRKMYRWALIALLFIGSLVADAATDLLLAGAIRPGVSSIAQSGASASGQTFSGITATSFGAAVLQGVVNGPTGFSAWNLTTGTSIGTTPTNLVSPSNPNCFRASSDGMQIYSMFSHTRYSVLDMRMNVTKTITNTDTARCLDFAAGGGNNTGMAAMLLTNSTLLIFLKAATSDGTTLTLVNKYGPEIVNQAVMLSLAEQLLEPDYSRVRYFVGTSNGTIASVICTNGSCITQLQDITPFGYTSSSGSYNVTALSYAKDNLHVGGIGFYTIFTVLVNLVPRNLVVWNRAAGFSQTISYIRVPLDPVAKETTAWLLGYIFFGHDRDAFV